MEEEEIGKIQDLIDLLRQHRDFYLKIVESTFDMEILLEKDSHKIFASLIFTQFNYLLEKQHNFRDVINLSEILIGYGDRLTVHRFTKKQLDDYNNMDELIHPTKKIIDYYLRMDNIRKFKPRNLQEIKEKLNELEEMWKIDPLPAEGRALENELNNRLVDSITLKEYFIDLFTKLSQTYETFVLFSTLILILFRKGNNQETESIENSLKEGKKLRVNQLYQNKNRRNNSLPLLKDYLSSSTDLQLIEKIYLWTFGKKGLHNIRNLVIHHQGEKGKCEFIDDYILLQYKKNEFEKLKYEQIADFYRQTNILIFIIYYTCMSFYFHSYSVILEIKLKNEMEK